MDKSQLVQVSRIRIKIDNKVVVIDPLDAIFVDSNAEPFPEGWYMSQGNTLEINTR